MNENLYSPETTQIQRAELLQAVREETTGSGHDVLQAILRDLDKAESVFRARKGCVICQQPFRFWEEISANVCAPCVIKAKETEKWQQKFLELEQKVTLQRDEMVRAWFEDELADFKMVMNHCSEIYMHCSGGRISKPNTLPSEVMGEMEKLFISPAWYVICVDNCDNTYLGIEGPFDYKEDAEKQLQAEKDRGATESELFYTGSEEPA